MPLGNVRGWSHFASKHMRSKGPAFIVCRVQGKPTPACIQSARATLSWGDRSSVWSLVPKPHFPRCFLPLPILALKHLAFVLIRQGRQRFIASTPTFKDPPRLLLPWIPLFIQFARLLSASFSPSVTKILPVLQGLAQTPVCRKCQRFCDFFQRLQSLSVLLSSQ